MFYDEPFLAPLSRDHLSEIPGLCDFVSRKIVSTHRSFTTATDIDERIELLERISNLNASLILIALASLTESQSILETSKTIYRETTK